MFLPSEKESTAVARSFIAALKMANSDALTVFLYGDLGSGKSFFVRSLLRTLGFTGNVPSPTYSLLQSYEVSSKTIHHFDLYRLSSAEEWFDLGFDEVVVGPSFNFVEWPERLLGAKFLPDISLNWSYGEQEGRLLTIQSHSEQGERLKIIWEKNYQEEAS